MPQRPTRTVETLGCKLTNDELLEKGDRLSNILTEIENRLAEKNILKDQVLSKKEYREVECSIEYDWEKKVKRVIRTDNYVVVREAPINEFEIQEYMKELEENESEETNI